jgi:hypothetical protein
MIGLKKVGVVYDLTENTLTRNDLVYEFKLSTVRQHRLGTRRQADLFLPSRAISVLRASRRIAGHTDSRTTKLYDRRRQVE